MPICHWQIYSNQMKFIRDIFCFLILLSTILHWDTFFFSRKKNCTNQLMCKCILQLLVFYVSLHHNIQINFFLFLVFSIHLFSELKFVCLIVSFIFHTVSMNLHRQSKHFDMVSIVDKIILKFTRNVIIQNIRNMIKSIINIE